MTSKDSDCQHVQKIYLPIAVGVFVSTDGGEAKRVAQRFLASTARCSCALFMLERLAGAPALRASPVGRVLGRVSRRRSCRG